MYELQELLEKKRRRNVCDTGLGKVFRYDIKNIIHKRKYKLNFHKIEVK